MNDAAQVQSPCTSICAMDTPTGLCAGCYRTLDEIAGWMDLSADKRRALLAELARRRTQHGDAIASRRLGGADSEAPNAQR